MQGKKIMKSLYGILFCIFFVTSTKIDANESWLPNPLVCMVILDVVIICVLIAENYINNPTPQNLDSKIKKNHDEDIFKNYDSTLSISKNIALELEIARQDAVQNMSLVEYEIIDTVTQDILINKKDMLRNIPKSLTMKGSMRSPSVSLSGSLDIANIVALQQANFLSKGLIENSLSKKLSFIQGNFIISSSVFYGTTHIENASMVSYYGCFLDQVCVHSKDMILDLRDTIVTGDIIFDHPGIIVIDKKTVLGGTVSNAQIMMTLT